MNVRIINRQENSSEVVEMSLLPQTGQLIEDRAGRIFEVLEVTHTPFDPKSVARVLIGHRNSLGFVPCVPP